MKASLKTFVSEEHNPLFVNENEYGYKYSLNESWQEASDSIDEVLNGRCMCDSFLLMKELQILS